MIYYYFKYLKIRIARIVFRTIYPFFPIKSNRITFCSFEGLQYTCNPKYIFESMYHRFGREYDYVWILARQADMPEEFRQSVKIVKPKSAKYIYYLITSGVIISYFPQAEKAIIHQHMARRRCIQTDFSGPETIFEYLQALCQPNP